MRSARLAVALTPFSPSGRRLISSSCELASQCLFSEPGNTVRFNRFCMASQGIAFDTVSTPRYNTATWQATCRLRPLSALRSRQVNTDHALPPSQSLMPMSAELRARFLVRPQLLTRA